MTERAAAALEVTFEVIVVEMETAVEEVQHLTPEVICVAILLESAALLRPAEPLAKLVQAFVVMVMFGLSEPPN